VRSDLPFIDVAAGGDFTCARTADQEVWCWGNERPVPGWPEVADTPRMVRLPQPASALAAGRRHACVLDNDGRASCWGWNVDGETGTGTSGLEVAMVASPTPVSTDVRFASISAGLGFTCGVTTDAGVHCWGSNVDQVMSPFNASERCGDVQPIPCASRPVPVQFPGRVRQVAVGTSHVCALTDTGRLFCWGSNGAGQVGAHGPGVPIVRVPSEVVIDRSGPFTAVSSGGIHSCAVTASRRAYCWGAYDHYGSDQASAEALAPTIAAGGTQFQSISAGQIHACGLDTRGRVLCWGDTILGALGIR
jgi:alpha-tubulin suppressor-like RCC1 family protein